MPKSRLRKRLENSLGVAAVSLVRRLACAGSHAVAMRRAARLGRLAHRLFAGWRRTAERQLAQCFPEWSADEVASCTRRVFVGFVKTMFEFLRGKQTSDEELLRLVRIEGIELVREAQAAGKPVIVLAAHYDNWEWAGRRLALAAGQPLSVIARSQDDDRLTRLIDDTRSAGGLIVIDRDDARGALRTLRSGGILGIVPDQNSVVSTTFPMFFGRPAATVIGPARLAARTGAAVFHYLARREADDSHTARIFPIADAPDPGEDAEGFTQAWTAGLERWIREVPDQWMWFHKRWKTQPPVSEEQPAP